MLLPVPAGANGAGLPRPAKKSGGEELARGDARARGTELKEGPPMAPSGGQRGRSQQEPVSIFFQ